MAAAIHLGHLPSKVRTEEELRFLCRQYLPFQQGVKASEFGVLLHMGQGGKGETVYILATGKKPDLLLKTLTNMLPVFGEDPLNYHFINCHAYISQGKERRTRDRSGLCGWYNQIGQMVRQVQRGL